MRSSLMKTAHVDLSDVAKQEFGYATVGMTNFLGGRNKKTSAQLVHSSLNLPPGKSAPPNEQNGWGRICELTWRALVWGKGAPQVPPLRYPRIPVEASGAGKVHAVFLNEDRTLALSDVAKQEFGYATVGMTNLFGGTGLKASAHRVHSSLNLPTGESAPPNELICLRDGLKASALRVHSSLNLPPGKSAPPNEQICLRDGFEKQTLSAFIPSLTCRRQVSRSG